MDTYTVRALTVTDAALVKVAGDKLAAYDKREGMTQDNSLNGTWDMTQAARLAEHLRSALEIIEHLTRPASDQVEMGDDGFPLPLPPVRRSRVERVTGTGWPA